MRKPVVLGLALLDELSYLSECGLPESEFKSCVQLVQEAMTSHSQEEGVYRLLMERLKKNGEITNRAVSMIESALN